jgi:hypothetical protein
MKPSKRRLGSLYSTGASTVLCFFWSIPTAFIASLTSVGALKEDIPRLGDLVDKYPWLEQVLVQLAPMLLLFLNEVFLPEFLKMFATWEGHISSVDLEASLFLKLSQFMVSFGKPLPHDCIAIQETKSNSFDDKDYPNLLRVGDFWQYLCRVDEHG